MTFKWDDYHNEQLQNSDDLDDDLTMMIGTKTTMTLRLSTVNRIDIWSSFLIKAPMGAFFYVGLMTSRFTSFKFKLCYPTSEICAYKMV